VRRFGIEPSSGDLLFALLVGAGFLAAWLIGGNDDSVAFATATGISGALLARVVLDGARQDSVDGADLSGFLRKKAVDYVVTVVGFVLGAVLGTVGLSVAIGLVG